MVRVKLPKSRSDLMVAAVAPVLLAFLLVGSLMGSSMATVMLISLIAMLAGYACVHLLAFALGPGRWTTFVLAGAWFAALAACLFLAARWGAGTEGYVRLFPSQRSSILHMVVYGLMFGSSLALLRRTSAPPPG